MRRRRESVIFAWVNDQFRLAPQSFERLVHLLATEDRDVPVYVAAHEQRGRGDIFDLIEWREPLPESFVFPRIAQFGEIVSLVLVVAVEAGEFPGAGAGNC